MNLQLFSSKVSYIVDFCKIDSFVLDKVLIAFINKLISILFKSMMAYTNSFKPKPKNSSEIPVQYLSAYPDNNRKSITNTNQPPKKEKVYRKVITQTNQSEPTDFNKYSSKVFKPQSKGGSPIVKKNMLIETNSPTNKLCFSNNTGKIKRVKKSSNLNQKAVTQTGPIIQRVMNAEIPKPHFDKEKQRQKVLCTFSDQKSFFTESKKENFFLKKAQSKPNINTYIKARLHTQGTMDSTPMITSYDIQLIQIIGQGTFGKVYKGRVRKTGQIVAVKKVFQDPKYKNREVQIVNMLKGDFLMKVMGSYATFQEGGQFLNIVMAYYEGDLYSLIKQNGKKGLTNLDIKIISYQIFRGLLFIHQLRIAHRDIKPHNILYKGKKVAICDFGSAKILTNEPNLPYICSRCYRAPELIFGATHYSTMIDMWSVGCVLLEMIQGTPLFIGESSVDHLIEIIKVLGTPTKTQVIDMNPNYDLNDYKFPKVKKRQWNKIFPKSDPLLLDLLSQIMIYSPKQRLNAAQALAHEYFDELREEQVYRLLQKQFGFNLFNFLPEQLKGHEHLIPKLLPTWHREQKQYHFF